MVFRLQGLFLFFLILVMVGCVAINNDPRTNKQKAEAYVHLASEYFRVGNLEQSLDYLKKAERLDYESYAAHSMLAIVYDRLGRTREADKQFSYAVDSVSKDSHEFGAIHNNYGAFLCTQKRYADAEREFQLAISNRLYNTPELAYENAGLCVLRQEKYQKAENYFKYSLELNPVMPRSLFALAELMYEKKDYLRARAFIERLHDAGAVNAPGLLLGMKIESALGDQRAAKVYEDQLRDKFPGSEEVNNLRMQGSKHLQ